MIPLNFKLNKDSIRLIINTYTNNFSIDSEVGILISGYIKDDKFYLQTISPEVYFFKEDLIKTALKVYNKETNKKIK